jgi:hypothetical protein
MHTAVHPGNSTAEVEELPTNQTPLLSKILMAQTISPDGRLSSTHRIQLKDLLTSGTTIIVGLSTEWFADTVVGLDIPTETEGMNLTDDLRQMLEACESSHNATMVILVDPDCNPSALAKICERQPRPFVTHGLTGSEPTVFTLDPDDQSLDREYLHFCSGNGMLNNEVAVFHNGELVTTTMRTGKHTHKYGLAIQRMDERIARTTMVN